MSETQLTRCPGCATVYRVTEAQLALREGQVRCGHCRAVFDATTHRVEVAPVVSVPLPSPISTPAPAPAEAEPEPELKPAGVGILAASPKATPDAQVDGSLDAQGDEATDAQVDDATDAQVDDARDAQIDDAADAKVDDTRDAPSDTQVEPLPDAAALEAARAALRPRKRRTRRGSAFYAVAAAVLVAALAVQSAALFRDAIVARVPKAAPALATLCSAVPCRTGPRHDAGALSIEGSDLAADPAHHGLLVLTATLRNREASAVAWPDIELSLTDSSDRTVVRRVLAPTDYLPASADHAGLDAHSERQIKLFVDASATRQAGYRLYLFYP